MKRVAGIVVVVFAVALLAGCATLVPQGAFYTGVNLPNNLGDGKDITYTKVGKAEAKSYFCLVATGDASLAAAIKNGDIKTVKYVDYHVDNILGFGTYTTTVYGD